MNAGNLFSLLFIASLAQSSDQNHDKLDKTFSPRLVCDRILEDFSTTPVGAFPKGWTTRENSQLMWAIDKKLFVVKIEDSSRVLHVTYDTETVTIVRPVADWDLEKYPILRWRWKAIHLPQGGDERSLSTNDSAASVYVGWDAGFPFKISSIRYAWSSTQPKGTYVTRRFKHDHIFVLESGEAWRFKWKEEQINVANHAEKIEIKAKTPNKPSGIALTSDADATESKAEAYFADFRLCRYE